jgi:broad specificity phosphatase PhoE
VLLRDDRFELAVSSDLQRAAETARIILAGRAVPLRLDADWREMRFGLWEGLSWDEILARTPSLRDVGRTTVRAYEPPEGEDFDQLCVRIARATERVVAELEPHGTALIATHAGPLHALLHNLLGESEAEALNVRFRPASATRFRNDGAGWKLVAVNETAAPNASA